MMGSLPRTWVLSFGHLGAWPWSASPARWTSPMNSPGKARPRAPWSWRTSRLPGGDGRAGYGIAHEAGASGWGTLFALYARPKAEFSRSGLGWRLQMRWL